MKMGKNNHENHEKLFKNGFEDWITLTKEGSNSMLIQIMWIIKNAMLELMVSYLYYGKLFILYSIICNRIDLFIKYLVTLQ